MYREPSTWDLANGAIYYVHGIVLEAHKWQL